MPWLRCTGSWRWTRSLARRLLLRILTGWGVRPLASHKRHHVFAQGLVASQLTIRHDLIAQLIELRCTQARVFGVGSNSQQLRVAWIFLQTFFFHRIDRLLKSVQVFLARSLSWNLRSHLLAGRHVWSHLRAWRHLLARTHRWRLLLLLHRWSSWILWRRVHLLRHRWSSWSLSCRRAL